MGNCAGGPKTKEGPAPEPAPAAKEEEVKTESEEKKIKERDVEMMNDEAKPATEDTAQSLAHLLDSQGNQAEVKEEKEELQAEAKAEGETEEVKKEQESKESSEVVAPAENKE